MRAVRIIMALAGLAALGYGASLFWQFAQHNWVGLRSAAEFLAGGPILHDAILAPFVGALGLVIGRKLPKPWRTPVRVGAAVSGVLGLISVPALWRANAGLPNPGLDDRDYPLGLLVALAVIWLSVLVIGLLNRRSQKIRTE